MAVAPDISLPVFGYFVTNNFDIVEEYILKLIETQNISFVFLLHSSAHFMKDDEEQELHLAITNPIVVDPQLPDDLLLHLLRNQRDLAQEPELYENIQGSGWTYIPGTVRYWFKVYPCQPNNGACPNSANVSDFGEPPQEEEEYGYRTRKYNLFLYAVLEHYARTVKLSIPRERFIRYETLEKFNLDYNMGFPLRDFDMEINMQDLPEYHRQLGYLNIRVFSMRGNILYAKKLSSNNEDFIDLYLNSNNQFAYIRNLWSLFKKKYNRFFCMKCLKWGQKDKHACEKVLKSSKTEEVFIPDIPPDRHALVAYADFESYVLDKTYHRTSGWGCIIIDRENNIYDSQYKNVLAEPNIIKSFVEYLTHIAIDFSSNSSTTDICPLCNKQIENNSETILGTNFINGKSGTHHLNCWDHKNNTMYVFFHNFRGYDSHFLIKELVANTHVKHLSASTMEKFNMIQITGWEQGNLDTFDKPYLRLTFKDTFNFFTMSLAKMVKNVEDWRFTPENARNDKGLFPYDWFDSKDKLMSTSLPEGPWHNCLTNIEVDCTGAFEIWNEKKFNFFYEYHDYYMMLDVIQLADCFEEFRRTTVNEFNTDPVHFQGAPGLTWYLGLCQNPELFKIITDTEVYMDIQNNIRGGISQAMSRYMNVEDKPEQSMFFLDVNSLYSKCMTYKMPGKYLRKITELPENWKELWNENTSETALLKVDLHYPEHLHDRDWPYPLAPHKYNDRLCTTFKDKNDYMIHSELLQFYLERGLLIIKFHYAYIFEQDYTLREYVQTNIEKRRATKSEIMKTLYKLLNNSLYGKTCENVNKYRIFAVIEDTSSQEEEDFYTRCNPELMECSSIIACGNNYLVEKPKKTVMLNKPIQIGFTILDFAKREMYKFISVLQDNFGDKVIPIYTDTDSLLLWCDFSKPWKHFYENEEVRKYLDFEKVPDNWGVKTKDTDKQSGLWAPEAGGKEIVEYVGLRAKCYAYRFADNENVIKNKGVPKSAMIGDENNEPREKITISHYRKALFEGTDYKVAQFAIRSFAHEVMTCELYKLGISANDLKRSVLANRALSLPFGYKGELFRDIANDLDDTSYLDT